MEAWIRKRKHMECNSPLSELTKYKNFGNITDNVERKE